MDTVDLCRTCRYSTRVKTTIRSEFFRCRLADTRPQFPKYPPLPVVRCAGYERILPSLP